MTAFAFILGVVPLMIATGPGAEMRQSLGTAVFSGMLGVTFFGLFLTPVFYVTLRSLFPVRKPKEPPEGHVGEAVDVQPPIDAAVVPRDQAAE